MRTQGLSFSAMAAIARSPGTTVVSEVSSNQPGSRHAGNRPNCFIDASTNGLHHFDEDRGIYRFALEDKVVPLPILWEPIEILTTHYAMEMLKHRVMKHVRSGGRVPISLEQLPSQPGCMDSNVDGWGRKMELRFENRRATVIISYGRDGKPGGTDDDEDIVGDFDATPEKDAGPGLTPRNGFTIPRKAGHGGIADNAASARLERVRCSTIVITR